jgi:hypothetical protein
MTSVLLIYPPFEGKNYLKKRSPFPIGPLYMAAFLKDKGIDALVVDFSWPPKKRKTQRPSQLKTGQSNYFRFGWTDLQIKKFLIWHAKNYDYIGVSSLMSSNWSGGYKVIDLVKETTGQDVIIGGPHATVFPEHVIKHSKADYICIGEGEAAMWAHCTGVKHPAIIKTKGKLQHHSVGHSFIDNMNMLPFPNRSLLYDDRTTKELYITFSRGCPHKCSFCGSHLIQGRTWRHKDIDTCIKEVHFYIKEWGVKKFIVEDDNPCPGKKGIKHLKKFCQRIINEFPKLRFEVSHGIPVYATADKELCDLMWKAGFREMTFPIESTDIHVLRDMKKADTPNHWRQGIKNWRYEKNHPAQIILGYPFVETITTMLTTMLDIAHVKGRIWASHFRLNKGTPLFDRCLSAKYISDTYDPVNTQSFYIETERFKIKDLQELMQISRGINFATERGFNPIEKVPECTDFYDFTLPEKPGDVVAKGRFKFVRGQNYLASILIARLGKSTQGRPICSFGSSRDIIIYKGEKPSVVYDSLIEILTGRKRKTIEDFL